MSATLAHRAICQDTACWCKPPRRLTEIQKVDRTEKRIEDFIRRQAVVLQREFDSDVAHEVCVRLADAIEAGRHRR